MSAPQPHIALHAVSLSYGGSLALSDVSFTLAQGEVLTVLGPSGCGKTSLLRLIAGLSQPDRGRVLVNGAAPVVGQESAVVFQNFRLLPWKTLAENVGFGLSQLPRAAREPRVARALETVGLSRFGARYPRELSGGMQQRAALARALAVDPAILLMDEPFASLDAQSRELMQTETLRLVSDRAARSVVFVTHSVDEALLLGDRVLLMSPRPGRVTEILDLPFKGTSEARRSHPAFAQLRQNLWDALRQMVLSDPQSDFYGREAPSRTE